MAKSIVIIGGGVIGLCAASACASRGHRVTVVERNGPTEEGCSFGNAGMIVPSHFIPLAAPGMVRLGLKWMWNPESPFYIKPRLKWDLLGWAWKFYRAANAAHVARAAPLLRDLSLASRACFEELAAAPGADFGLVKKGLIMLCQSEHALREEVQAADHARRLGIPAEVLDAKQTARLEPAVRMTVAGSVYFPKDCHLSPARFMQALQARAAEAGTSFRWRTPVTGWRFQNNRVTAVLAHQDAIKADEFVLCGGSWSPLVARQLGLQLPMQPGKGYSLTLPHPRQLPEICAIFNEARVAVTPIGNSLRFGGTMEMSGLNEDINPARIRGIIRSVPRYFPDFTPDDFRDVPVWRGLRPCSPDGLPYLGRTNRYSNLTVATGHAMMGLSLGPITGRLLAEILSDQPPSIGLDLLHPDRYDS